MTADFKNYVNRARKELADCLNRLENVHFKVDAALEENRNWDTDVNFKIEDAAGKLGFALAALTSLCDEMED